MAPYTPRIPSLRFMSSLLLLAVASATSQAGEAISKPLLAQVFSSHAVLQRERAVPVWGWAGAGAGVQVRLLGADAAVVGQVTATTGADGRWQASLPARPAGGPYTLQVAAGGTTAESTDVLFGDVWLCSGQSNMEWPVSGAKDPQAEKAAATWPLIRHIAIPKFIAGLPQPAAKAAWTVCSPNTVLSYSAVGYFFGRQLHRDLSVPIGLVNSAYGGTRAECWVTPATLAALPAYAPKAAAFADLVQRWTAQTASTGTDYDTLVRAWYRDNDPGSAGEQAAWAQPEADLAGWSDTTLPARLKQAKAVPDGFTGTIWLRRDIDVPAGAAGKGGSLNLIRVKDMNAAWVNGTSVGDSEQVNYFRKQRVPPNVLRAGRNTIAIRLVCLEGECGLTGKAEELALTPEGGTPIALAGGWKLRLGAEFAKAKPMPVRFDRVPAATSLSNGMIEPLLPMALRGAIWYQGESDTDTAYNYRSLLPALIGDWRTRFAQPEMPFLIVQLANHMGRQTRPETSAWAEMREAQALTARTVPHSGLAVAIDIGEAENIHPLNKQEVGRRLALVAESVAYGMPVACSGPRYRAMTVEGAAIRLGFDAADGLRAVDGKELVGFTIAGADRKFIMASARIDAGAVVVSAPGVAQPVAVRYAWANNPPCNLSNASGLPASPFRTDDWPCTTWPKDAK